MVVEEVNAFVTDVGQQFQQKISDIVSKYNILCEDSLPLNDLVQSTLSSFSGMETEYLRIKYFEKSKFFF